ncbi:hypothetical protein PHYSODRAFT_337413 [Phytophthora sojae]|uniref:Uncharacterized protein n=1 Tax=Phytophthora sojae (strain P6497) TaxID=1094619 RepID=G5A0Z9_PHYSP|nr:hypothetical protein PHYSODRAFT_337413 [Phytophthora sojae]EGZ10631.1 hypothetical protein PHYSODRAFT_337413 [Phytophthora sojae]|eukprot:XP_009533376.1 hypothetical protein PHYSODRAFT_337413 [Phytophthora sojae]
MAASDGGYAIEARGLLLARRGRAKPQRRRRPGRKTAPRTPVWTSSCVYAATAKMRSLVLLVVVMVLTLSTMETKDCVTCKMYESETMTETAGAASSVTGTSGRRPRRRRRPGRPCGQQDVCNGKEEHEC